MSRLTPAEQSEKWARRLKGSVSDIQRGIDRVSVSPGEMAADKIDKMKARLIAAFDSGKVEARLRAVPLSEWKAITKKKVAERLSGGVDAAGDKFEKFSAELNSHIDSGLPTIQNMPDLTIEDSKARASAWIDHMSKFRRS